MALPGPTSLQVRAVDPVLTSWMNTRSNDDSDFIADQAFVPSYREGEISGTYFRQITDMRSAGLIEIEHGSGAAYARIGFGLTTATYNCIEYGVEVPLDRRLQRASQSPLSLQQLAVNRAEAEIKIRREIRTVGAMFGTGDWTNEATLGGAAQWDDAGGDPLANLWTAKRSIKLNAGKNANCAIAGYDTFRVAVQNGDITGLMPSALRQSQITFSELVSRLAEAFEVSRFFVGRAVQNTANLLLAEVYAFIWTDNFWMGYCPTGGPEGPCYASFAATDGGAPTVVDRYYSDETRTDVVRVREDRDEVVVDALAGYLTIDCAN